MLRTNFTFLRNPHAISGGLIFLYFFLSIPLLAQNQLTVTPTNCLYKEGDDPAWARPEFDDHDWSTTRPDLDRLAARPYLWTRCRVDLWPLARTGPVYVQVQAMAAWQMYIDGEPAGSFGDIASGHITMDITQRRPLPERMAGRPAILVALRLVERGLPMTTYRKTAVLMQAGDGRTLASSTSGTRHADARCEKSTMRFKINSVGTSTSILR